MSAEDKVVEDAVTENATVENDEKSAIKDEWSDIIKTVAIALIITLVFRTLFFQPFTIPSASMEPNLYEGDYIVVRKWDYGYSKHSIQFSPPVISGRIFEKQAKRGDIVVFKLPSNTKVDYIKRVIGLPGDRVQVKNGQVFINEQPVTTIDKGPISAGITYATQGADIQEEQLPDGADHLTQNLEDNKPEADDTQEFTVPEGQYFVMGDNRDNSLDSRFSPADPFQPGVGFVPAENLEGKAVMVLISWNKGASLFKPWTWLDLRWDRFFKSLK
ncbi:signal peptidase I [Asticcacaulis sp.]|uniref:signal peptidase I n=1 Tax=Asticcacaulis sp. TaxID=1872648 RepID=UPI00260ABC7F|nr:signal peptidase I [Asticcacaulis sp.]